MTDAARQMAEKKVKCALAPSDMLEIAETYRCLRDSTKRLRWLFRVASRPIRCCYVPHGGGWGKASLVPVALGSLCFAFVAVVDWTNPH